MSNPTPEAPPVEEPQNTAAPEATPPEPQETPKPDAADALRRKLAEEERARKRLEDQQKKAAEEQAAQQGEWQKLAEQRQAELEQTRKDAERTARESLVTRLATRAKFIDPADVVGRVAAEDAADEASIETALARIAERSPHLIAKEAPAVPEIGQVLTPSAPGSPAAPGTPDGKPAPPAGKAPLNSLDEWEALPQAERSQRMAEVDWLYLHEQ